MLSPLLAANFGPGPEAAAEGRAAGQGVCFFCFSQPTSGLARRGRQRGTQVDGKFAFHRLWESPTTSARRQWRLGIWTKSLHPCASRHRVRADGGLAGRTAAAAGSCWTCWRSQECSAPSPSRVLCCRLCLTLTEKKKKQAWKEVARHPPLSAGPACLAGAAQEEHLLLLRKATADGLLLEHMYVLVCIYTHLVSECAPTRRLSPTSPSLG